MDLCTECLFLFSSLQILDRASDASVQRESSRVLQVASDALHQRVQRVRAPPGPGLHRGSRLPRVLHPAPRDHSLGPGIRGLGGQVLVLEGQSCCSGNAGGMGTTLLLFIQFRFYIDLDLMLLLVQNDLRALGSGTWALPIIREWAFGIKW